jgi:uncharacterized protein YkwD
MESGTQSRESKDRLGCRSEVLVKFSYLILIALIFAVSGIANAQNSKPQPILVAEIGGNGRAKNVSLPRISRGDSSVRKDGNFSLERQTFNLLNVERASRGLEALVWDDRVAEVARLHSRSMASEKYFSHRGNDGSMVDDRADRLGMSKWSAIGENIAFLRGYDDPASFAVETWMNSSSHRKNLLGNRWSRSAVGVAVAADGAYYFTQVFVTSD